MLHQEKQRLYGIDWDGPVPTNREDYVHVEVPNVNITMRVVIPLTLAEFMSLNLAEFIMSLNL